MVQSEITPTQIDLLRKIYDHNLNGQAVKSTDCWLWEESHVTQSAISNYILKLQQNNFLEKWPDKTLVLTDKARRFLTNRPLEPNATRLSPVTAAQLRIRGQVMAGQATQEDLLIDLDEYGEDGSPTLTVPEVRQGKNCYVLQVVGSSMVHEGIFDGDYVIVEEFMGFETPRENQLIVTYYMLFQKNDPERLFHEEQGPTLKYMREVEEQSGDKYYRLGWKKDAETSEYKIRAAQIRPVGKVIGVYRPYS